MRPLVAWMLLAMLVLPSVPAASEAPHVLVRIVNDGEAATVTLRVGYRDEAPYFEREIALAAGETIEAAVEGEPGPHVVELELPERPVYERRPDEIIRDVVDPDGPPGLMVSAYNFGCPGPYGVEFSFALASHTSSDPLGCMVLTPEFEAMLAEARDAKVGFPRASIDVPMPGSSDRGVYNRPEIEIPFEWRADVPTLDEFGREARVAEVTYLDPYMSGMGSGGGLFGGSAWVSKDNTLEVLRYRDGDVRPMSWSRTLPQDPNAATAAVAQLAREIRYDDSDHVASCLLRNVFQGTTVHAGDAFAAADVCPIWPGADWHAREAIEWGGLRALPLYQLDESADRLHVARILLVDDVPYIAAYERFTLPAGRGVETRAFTLERLERAGSPISLAPFAPAPAVALDELDPHLGPALTDARFALTLAEASAAARSDPLLLVRGRDLGGAFLAGAAYAEEQDPGSPARRAMWLLTFIDGDIPRYVGCERLAADTPLAAPIRCESPPAWEQYQFGAPVYDPPAMTASDLPAAAPSFDLALARWDAARADGPSERASFAVYRSWRTAEGDAPVVAVGLAPPRAMTPLGAEEAGAGDFAALEFDGSTLAVVEIAQTVSTFDPAGLALFRTAEINAGGAGGAFADAAPFVVGGGLSLALLVALALLLYSRLVRARVLDDATRGRIHDVVTREPGLHAAAVLERLGKNTGVGEYHLGVLVREGFLTSVATPGFTRYFVTGRFGPNEMRAIAALREGQNGRLFHLIRAAPGIQLGQLAEQAGVSLPYASKGVARLVEAGLVDKVQVGRAVALHALDAPAVGMS